MASRKKSPAVDDQIGSQLLNKMEDPETYNLKYGGVPIVKRDKKGDSRSDMKSRKKVDPEDYTSNLVQNLESLVVSENSEKMKTERSNSSTSSESLEALMMKIREQQLLIDSQQQELALKNREVKNLRQAVDSGTGDGVPCQNASHLKDSSSGEIKGMQQEDYYNTYINAPYTNSAEVKGNGMTGDAADLGAVTDTIDRTIHNLQGSFPNQPRPPTTRGDSWPGYTNIDNTYDPTPNIAIAQPGGIYNESIWAPPQTQINSNTGDGSSTMNMYPLQSQKFYAQRFTSNKPSEASLNSLAVSKKSGSATALSSEPYGYGWPGGSEGYRGSSYEMYSSSDPNYPTNYSGQVQSTSTHYGRSMSETASLPGTGPGGSNHPGAIGNHLSPTAAEFKSSPSSSNNSVWNSNPSSRSTSGSYISQPDRSSYNRQGSDRSYYCNWSNMIERVLSENDQQASLFLQQRLKMGTQEQKYQIIDAIIERAYPLMTNRFGNFLVQRCFEHGTPQQAEAIAMAMKGKTLQLSMDAFGCHVVQKAFDCVNESFKATMVHELLRRIPETVVHRYACHVWQKLFELRWIDSPPQIMKYVNEALNGMWPEVALGETGSLVVQNIFENCLEEDKRPCVNEVLLNIEHIARGQYGNWCIQHICEHGSPSDRAMALDNVIQNATEYSMDQFASKIVEKCLKVAGPEFVDRYLDRVCEGRPDRPRIPLIDIASDQYGNYLVQHILQTTVPHHREIVASHIRKHMVSLRGSKFGSRVGMLCSNHNYNKSSIPHGQPTITASHRYSSHSNRWNYR